MTHQQKNAPKRLVTWLAHWLSIDPSELKVQLLAGDGSTRQFFRALSTKEPKKTYLVMLDPGWDLSKDYAPHQQVLEQNGIGVPSFLMVDEMEGIIVMEDLGDDLLQHYLQRNPSERGKWITESAKMLAHLHGKLFPVSSDLPAASREFDAQKYEQELNFTLEHLCERHLNLQTEEAKTREKLRSYCEEIAQFSPKVFCHRDYHTRNLMLHENKLYMIDFQDARLGPPHYDLASLLYDPYINLSAPEQTLTLQAYIETLKGYELFKQIQWETFDSQLRAVGFQRLVKAAGSFASFLTRHNKSTHMCYIVPSLEKAIELQGQPGVMEKHRTLFDLRWWIEMLTAIEQETL